MKVLCVDTSSKEIALGLFSGDKPLVEEYIAVNKNYNAVLMPLIMETLQKASVKLDDISIFAATLGPGSFTGIRVGMATMKGFAQPLKKHYFGASVLEVMAFGAGHGVVWPVIEAGRGELYTVKCGMRNGECGIKGGYQLLKPEVLIKKMKKNDTIIALRREGLAEKLRSLNPEIRVVEEDHISMKSFASLALHGGAGGKKGLFTASPVYIRPSEAEATLIRKKKEAAKKK